MHKTWTTEEILDIDFQNKK